MSKMSKKKVIGITGSMGSGKSAVSSIVKEIYPVIDCDKINADLLLPDHDGFNELKKNGLIELDRNGFIDKGKLSLSMFNDENVKIQVENILHPLIFKKMKEWIDLQESELVFVEMPLLFEVDATKYFDSIWCIVVSENIALERLEKYRNISKEEAKRRLAHQMNLQVKMDKSDSVIYNDGSLHELKEKVLEAIKKEKSWI